MLEQLHKSVKELFGNSTDADTIKQYAKVEADLEEAKKSQEELLKRNTSLTTALKDAVINRDFTKEEVKTSDPNKEVSLEEIANKIIKEK